MVSGEFVRKEENPVALNVHYGRTCPVVARQICSRDIHFLYIFALAASSSEQTMKIHIFAAARPTRGKKRRRSKRAADSVRSDVKLAYINPSYGGDEKYQTVWISNKLVDC